MKQKIVTDRFEEAILVIWALGLNQFVSSILIHNNVVIEPLLLSKFLEFACLVATYLALALFVRPLIRFHVGPKDAKRLEKAVYGQWIQVIEDKKNQVTTTFRCVLNS